MVLMKGFVFIMTALFSAYLNWLSSPQFLQKIESKLEAVVIYPANFS